MTLHYPLYERLASIPWLQRAGHQPDDLPFRAAYVDILDNAVQFFLSDKWADVKTEAQGNLTGYLSKHHTGAYGGYWNRLAKESRALVEGAVYSDLTRALSERNLPAVLLNGILLDVNRAMLELSYRHNFPKTPFFFERLLQSYEAGRLPCDWVGDLNAAGTVVMY